MPIDAGLSAATAPNAEAGGAGADIATVGGTLGDIQGNNADADSDRSRLDENDEGGCDCDTTKSHPVSILAFLTLLPYGAGVKGKL